MRGGVRERLREAGRVLVATGERFSEIEGPRLGASFSYYATFSIFPLLLLLVTVIGFVVGDSVTVRDRLLDAIAAPGGPVRGTLEQTLAAMQDARSSRGLSAAVAVVTLLFGASGAFVELEAAYNRIWRVPDRPSEGVIGTIKTFLLERLTGFAIVGGVALTLVASLISSAVLSALKRGMVAEGTQSLAPVLATIDVIVSIVLLAFALSLSFHFVPRSRPPLRHVAGGALLTSILLAGLNEVFATYLSHLTRYSAYGVVGGVLALATWIFLTSQILFLGVTLTRVICEHQGSAAAIDAKGPAGARAPERGSAERGDREDGAPTDEERSRSRGASRRPRGTPSGDQSVNL